MKTFLIVTALLLSIATFGFAEEGEAVLDLDKDTFDQAITDNELIMVEFYAPWCGHCKRLAPEYEKAAQELKGKIPLAKVNADNEINKPLASRFGIRGFPTLKVFRNGKESDYEGERSANAIVNFMKRQARPAITPLTTSEEVKNAIEEDKVVIIGFFANRDGNEYETFKNTAESLRNKFMFGEVVGNADINKEYEIDATPNAILFKKFDEGKNVLGSSFDDLAGFITKHSVPLIDEIGPENYKNYAESGLPLAYLFVDLATEGQKDEYVNRVRDIATATKGKLNWVYIDWSKYARHAEKLGLSGNKHPVLALENMEDGRHWAFDEEKEITAETVKEWIDLFLEDKLEPTIKSEPIPENNNGPVTVLVAKNFDEIVKDSNKDVLVEFYAPWCGHCKKLAPIYEELGQKFAGIDSVVIAKIDATANDVDSKLGIRGFPTLKFFSAKDKTPIDYNGDRTLDDMLRFIKENASTKFTLTESGASDSKDEL